MPGSTRFDVVRYLPALRRYALALTREATDADDLVHDVLVTAYERRKAFQPGSDLRLWLFAILHNRFIDDRRARSVRSRHAAREVDLAIGAAAPAQEDGVWLQQVRRAVEALPHDQRAALHLVAVEGMEYAEAANILDIPAGTLMSRLARARMALRGLKEAQAEPAAAPPARARLRIVRGGDGA